MKILVVGGAVRDLLLGRQPHDFDYMVQGATVEEFKVHFPDAVPVGKHFPVFLVEGEEYAFARVEQSVGTGHKDFHVEAKTGITVIDDLYRRDLTINALAMCPETGVIIGPRQSKIDLQDRILRHTSRAFVEDPLRVFRVARFAAQMPDFDVAPETLFLMESMIGFLDMLPAERVFGEMQKALEAPAPWRFFEVLAEANCLDTWFPEIQELIGVVPGQDKGKHAGEVDTFDHTMRVLKNTSSHDPVTRFAALCHDFGKSLSPSPPLHAGHDKEGLPLVEALCARLKVPNTYRKAALLFCEQHIRMHKILEMRPGKAVQLIEVVEKSMPGGLKEFLHCSVGDFMEPAMADHIHSAGKEVLSTKLPEKYHGRGKNSGIILQEIRATTWKQLK